MAQLASNSESDKPQQFLDSVYLLQQSFDGMTVRGALIVGTKCALIFDTLVFPQQTKALLSLCADREVIVVYSHADWDHVWGTCELFPARIVAQEECAKRFADVQDVQKTLNEYRAQYAEALAHIVLQPPLETFKNTLTLDLGGLSVELLHCPGHTKDSIVAIVPERSLLLGADCIETPLPLLNEDSENVPRWIQSLLELEKDPRIATCVPSHGTIGGREVVSNNIAYLKSLLQSDASLPSGLDDFYTAGHLENRNKTASLRS